MHTSAWKWNTHSLFRLFMLMALAAAAWLPLPVAAASPSAPDLLSFTLDKREAAKNEPIVATYRLSQPAKKVVVIAISDDGGPVSFDLPQTASVNARRTAGVITVTVPSDAASLSPLLIQLNIDGQLRGLWPLKMKCDLKWFFEPVVTIDRCPFSPAKSSDAAIQRFQHGTMIWLRETDSIYVLYDMPDLGNAGWLDVMANSFVDGEPESDPRHIPPAGLQQPVRGFGKVWRNSDYIRYRLGWALEKERGYTACFQIQFGGDRITRVDVTTPDNILIELTGYTGPVGWRTVDTVSIGKCG